MSTPARAQAPWQNWQNPPAIGDKLAGKVWSVGEGDFIAPLKLARELANAKYVLIGETHDNADHHRLQAWLIDQVAARGKPAIVMEMISSDQSQVLSQYMAGPDANPAGLGPALGWAKSGWPDWIFYQPIAEAVFRAGLRLLPGDADRASVRSVAKNGIGSIEPAEQKLLALDNQLPSELAKALHQDIKASHCDLLAQTMLGPMVQVQRFRDAKLARALVNASLNGVTQDGGAILIAGNGHVRSDRAVPWYLARQDTDAKIFAVMLLEAGNDAGTVEELIITDPQGQPAADYFWFTPESKREDQCEILRRRFKK